MRTYSRQEFITKKKTGGNVGFAKAVVDVAELPHGQRELIDHSGNRWGLSVLSGLIGELIRSDLEAGIRVVVHELESDATSKDESFRDLGSFILRQSISGNS